MTEPARAIAGIAPDVLARAWEDPLVAESRAALEEALPALRFHEGLRRRWREARAEAAVREAWALAHSEGVRIDREELRALTAPGAPADADLPAGRALALGLWRAQWDVASRLPDLNLSGPVGPGAPRGPQAPALAAALHRDVCSALVAAGHLEPDGVGAPTSPSSIGVVRLADDRARPALLTAAVLEAAFSTTEVFRPQSAGVGAALSRWVLVTRGVEPTGVALTAAGIRADEAAHRLALTRWQRGDVAGAADWLVHVVDGVRRGVELGMQVALEIQAARLA